MIPQLFLKNVSSGLTTRLNRLIKHKLVNLVNTNKNQHDYTVFDIEMQEMKLHQFWENRIFRIHNEIWKTLEGEGSVYDIKTSIHWKRSHSKIQKCTGYIFRVD